MNQPVVTLLGDRSRRVGIGHAMRLTTVALALEAVGAQTNLLLTGETGEWDALIDATGVGWQSEPGDVNDPAVMERALDADPSVVVIDSYSISSQSVETIENSGSRVVLIDDNGEHRGFPCSLIVNPNAHGDQVDYGSIPGQRILSGIPWILIRPEVIEVLRGERVGRSGWVVAIGGTDPRDLAGQVAELLPPGESVSTVPGPDGPVGPQEFARRLAEAGSGVIAAGSTVWEAVFLGVPLVAVITETNQERVGQVLAERFGFEVVDLRTDDWVEGLGGAIRRLPVGDTALTGLIDGHGAARLAEEILNLASC